MVATVNSTGTSTGVVITPDSSGVLALQTGGTTAITVDTSQNVGIGTTTPSYKLDVQGTTANQRISSTTGTNAAYQIFSNTGQNFYVGLDNSAGNQILSAAYGATLLGTGAYPMVFGTSNTERMRIDSSGNLQLKGTGGTSTFNVFGNATITDQVQIFNNPTSSAQGILFRNTFNTGPSIFSTGAATTNSFISWVGGSGTQGSIVGNGSGINYNTTSDYRLKENVAPMTGALGVVAQLKPCTYTWKFDGAEGHGFIAHELQEIFPAAVSGEKDAVDKEGNPEYQGVDTSYLVATLTAAIQELKAINDTQAETINTLTARIEALEAK